MSQYIFVVDDNDTNLTVAAAALEADYRVLTVPSAEKMFTILGRRTPDLILLDVEMPDMDGFEACEKLREDPQWAAIPVIFVSGHVDDAVLTRARELGAQDVVKKPFDPAELLSLVKGYIKSVAT